MLLLPLASVHLGIARREFKGLKYVVMGVNSAAAVTRARSKMRARKGFRPRRRVRF